VRIGLVAPPWIPVPPPRYGGIEQVVASLGSQLAARGHDVTLVAAPGSDIPGVRTLTPLSEAPRTIGEPGVERRYLAAGLARLERPDVIIDHSGPLGAVLVGACGRPALHVVHGPLGPPEASRYARICARAPGLGLIALSASQRAQAPWLPFAGTCRPGLSVEDLPFGDRPGEHLAFLGRICPEKGPLEAIEVARRCGRPLMIAAKCREPAEQEYFERCVSPRLGGQIRYLGELGAERKYELLAGARALLFPIAWPEPFGLVLIEAMACGTPVLATRCGAVPEIVIDGTTGFVGEDVDALVDAESRLDQVCRTSCRSHVVERFSADAMASAYEATIAEHLATSRRGDGGPPGR
jgi:glycosyltransferase involved in cell wall biosynthesis